MERSNLIRFLFVSIVMFLLGGILLIAGWYAVMFARASTEGVKLAFQNGGLQRMAMRTWSEDPLAEVLEVTPDALYTGGELSIRWKVPEHHMSQGDWVGLFHSYSTDEEPIIWEYALEPEGIIYAPILDPGFYDVRYFRYNGTRNRRIMRSAEIPVVVPPPPPPPWVHHPTYSETLPYTPPVVH